MVISWIKFLVSFYVVLNNRGVKRCLAPPPKKKVRKKERKKGNGEGKERKTLFSSVYHEYVEFNF